MTMKLSKLWTELGVFKVVFKSLKKCKLNFFLVGSVKSLNWIDLSLLCNVNCVFISLSHEVSCAQWTVRVWKKHVKSAEEVIL